MTDQQPAGQYVVVGVNYWGRGDSQDEAKTQFQTAGGQLSKGYVVLYFDQTTSHFDGVSAADGSVIYRGVKPVEVARRQPNR